MTVLIAALVGFFAGRLLWLALRNSWRRQVFMRTNFQGSSLPTAAGIVIALALLLVEGGRAVAGSLGLGEEPFLDQGRAGVLIAVLGFTILGLLDDLTGGGDARGFAGHARALARGQLTSGGVKMLGGGLVSLVAAACIAGDRGWQMLVAAATIALAANLANLFDLRPGRTSKVGLVAFVVLVVAAGFDDALVPIAIAMGAAGALILDDLRERLMLGDTGANAVGAALGAGMAMELEGTAALIGLGVLVVLNGASEVVSFSKVIAAVPPLRALDMLGRRKVDSVDLRDSGSSSGNRFDEPSDAAPRDTVEGAPDDLQHEAAPQGTQRFSVEPPASQTFRPFTRDEPGDSGR